jgi:serine/threonine protein kinase
MAVTDQDPDPRVMADFLLGRLPDADAEHVAARLADDPRWRDLARAFGTADALLEALRSAAGAPAPEEAPPPELLERLEMLSAPSALWRTAGGDVSTRCPPAVPTAPASPVFLRPAQAPDELGRLAGFRILEILGRGGMGLVFRAEDVQLRRQVALKVIKPEHAADSDYRERFLREARAAARLHHDHVMPVHQIGEDNGVLFLAMPLLNGETLEDRLRRGGRLPAAEILRIGREAAEGLAAAHMAGVIHRDIKPSNIWLEEGTDRVKLLDFGLARFAEGQESVTTAGGVLGTPPYMSPEQADGRALDARSDLFSLGSVLYRMATGRQPFTRDSVPSTLRAVVDHHPTAPHEIAPGLSKPLSNLILHLLAKSPEQRPASAAAVAAALRAIEKAGETATEEEAPTLRRRRGCTITIAVTLTMFAVTVTLVTGAYFYFAFRGPATHTPEQISAEYQNKVYRVERSDGKKTVQGSGILLANDARRGLIATNLHVIAPEMVEDDKGRFVRKLLSDNSVKKGFTAEVKNPSQLQAKKANIAAYHKDLDLALLLVEMDNAPPDAVRVARQDKIRDGEAAVAMGYTLGTQLSTTPGIVSSHRGESGQVWTTCPVSPGSCGGPLFLQRGGLLAGLTCESFVKGGQNLNGAVPAEQIVSALREGRTESWVWEPELREDVVRLAKMVPLEG